MSEWTVYKITCVANGKSYIGITGRGIRTRWRKHCKDARLGKAWMLQRAIRKYGEEAFASVVLVTCASQAEAMVCERALVGEHRTYHTTGYGYNMTVGGDGVKGYVWTEEAREKHRKSRVGYRHSPETIAAMREAWERRKARGAIITPELRARMCAVRRSRGGTPKLSVWRRAFIQTPEGKAHMERITKLAADKSRGVPLSPERAAAAGERNRQRAAAMKAARAGGTNG